MADENSIVINISGDPKGFEKAVEQVQGLFKGLGKTVDKESKESSAAFASFIGNFASATALNAISAVRDGITAVFGKIKDGISDAAEADAAVRKFNLALANTGKFSTEASEGFQEFADTFEKASGIAEESVLSVAAKIQSFGKLSGPELERATRAAADLSAAVGVDFETAGSLFAKASQGNVEALKKLGVQVEDTGNAQRDFATALSQVEKQFGGSAQSAVQNFAGQVGLLENAYDDTFKAFGKSITDTPALTGLAKGFTGLFTDIKQLIEDNQDVIQSFVKGGVGLLIDGFEFLGKSVAFGFEAFGAFREILVNVNTAILAIPEAAFKVGAAFSTIFAPLDAIIAAFNQLTGSNIPQIKESFQAIGDEIGNFRDFAKADAEEFSLAQAQKAEAIRSFATGAADNLRAAVAEQELITDESRARELEKRSAETESIVLNEQQKKDRLLAEIADLQLKSKEIIGASASQEEALNQQKLVNQGKYNEANAALLKAKERNEKESIFAIRKFEDLTQRERVDNLKGTLNSIASLQSSGSKELFAIGKAAAVATATIDGIAAVQKALSSAPPPFNFALAALVGVAQASNLAKIASAKPPASEGFAQGGLVTGGIPGIDSVPIVAQQGEIVAPARSFDEVVEGTARQRGFVQGNENAGVIEKLDQLINAIQGLPSVTVQAGTLVADENGINALADALRDAVQFRGATLA